MFAKRSVAPSSSGTSPNATGGVTLPNRVTLTALAQMDTTAIAALSVEELALLAEEASETLAQTKALKERLDSALHHKYGPRATAARRTSGKDTGTVRIEDHGYTVVADLPKKVQWDQDKLAAIAAEIRAAGDDPAEYVATEYKVSERAYGAWPSSIRAAFEPARTVTTGKPSYQLIRTEEA